MSVKVVSINGHSANYDYEVNEVSNETSTIKDGDEVLRSKLNTQALPAIACQCGCVSILDLITIY